MPEGCANAERQQWQAKRKAAGHSSIFSGCVVIGEQHTGYRNAIKWLVWPIPANVLKCFGLPWLERLDLSFFNECFVRVSENGVKLSK